jgi:hypothetical protein
MLFYKTNKPFADSKAIFDAVAKHTNIAKLNYSV